MNKKYFKKILALFTIAFSTIILFGFTQTTYAASGDIRIQADYGAWQSFDSNDINLIDIQLEPEEVGFGFIVYIYDENYADLYNGDGLSYFEIESSVDLLSDNAQVIKAPFVLKITALDNGSLHAYVEDDIGDIIFDITESFTLSIAGLPDNKIPVISGQTTFVTNVEDAKDVSYFMQYLSAFDETDGDVTDSLKIIEDNYTANKRVLGNHTFTVEASDNSGNKATAILNVRVVDITAPVISGSTTVATIGYKETYNIENFRKTLTVSDNYDTLTNADIKIKTDGYTSNKTKLGTYNVVFAAKDSSGNEGTFTKPIKVIDNVKPTFSGPSVISTSNNTILTESDVRKQITAHDDIDGNLTGRIELVEDNFTGKGNVVGRYTIKYKVTDNAGNTETHTVIIERLDKIPPIIMVEDGVSIRTNPNAPLTHQIIIDILQATGQVVVNASTSFSFPLDEYTGNEQTPGIYAMSVVARSTNGNESIHNLSITVLDDSEGGDDIIIDGGDNIIIDFIIKNKVPIIIVVISLTAIGAFYLFKTNNKKSKRRR